MSKTPSKPKVSKVRKQINILIPGAVTHQIRQYETSGATQKLLKCQSCDILQKPKENWTGKDFTQFVKPKTNISWLPISDTFLKVVKLPGETPEEMKMMVELQLEKLSPLPVQQLVWDIYVMPNPEILPSLGGSSTSEDEGAISETENSESVPTMKLFTVVVAMANRETVTQHLELLEQSGFDADRLEIPILHQILFNKPQEQAVHIYPFHEESQPIVLTVWWFQNKLQNIDIIYLPDNENWKNTFATQTTQTVWGAQLAGWIPEEIHWTLYTQVDSVKTPVQEWFDLLTDLLGTGTATHQLTPDALADLNADLNNQKQDCINLLTEEKVALYRQHHINQLWFQGLVATLALYVAFCIVYFAGATIADFKRSSAESKRNMLDADYKMALKLKQQLDILQVQNSLKFAALDCYRLTAEKMPEELKLTRMNFNNGNELSFVGEAPVAQAALVTSFNEELSRALSYNDDSQLFFSEVAAPTSNAKTGANANTLNWRFSCKLNLPEIKTK